MIDRVRLTSNAKNQLITLKRKTGLEHNNSICRLALCYSLAAASEPPVEEFDYGGGLEIDWKVLTGNNSELYINLLALKLIRQSEDVTEDTLRNALASHLHRGISYLASKSEHELRLDLTKSLC